MSVVGPSPQSSRFAITRPLRPRLILLMTLLAVLPELVAGGLLGPLGYQGMRRQVLLRMDALAAGKAHLLETVVATWQHDLERFTSRSALRQAVVDLLRSPEPHQQSLLDLREYMASYFAPAGREEGRAVIISLRDGRLLAWSGYDSPHEAQRRSREYPLEQVALRNAAWLSPVHTLEGSSSPVLDAIQAIPAPDAPPSTAPVAAILWSIPLDAYVYPHFEPDTELGRTGELVLTDRNGLVLKDLRHEPGSVMRKVVSAEPVQRALSGTPGALQGLDYRGREVLAGYRQIPATGWGVVAKMDVDEALSSVHSWTRLWALLVLSVLVVSLLVANLVARGIARPIIGMANVAQSIAAGDLSVRMAHPYPDELGALAAVFNEMVGTLEEAQRNLESQVHQRTLALEHTNAQLERESAERDRIARDLAASEARLRTLSLRLSLAAESERRKMAADLHDTVIQLLGFAKMKLQLLERGLPENLAGELISIRETLQEAIAESRMIIAEVSPPALYRGGLGEAVKQLAAQFAKRHGLAVVVNDDESLQVADEVIRVLLFGCIRELLTNVVKHAGTDQAEVSLGREGEEAVVTVQDQGLGVPPAPQTHALAGFGLFSIRERLREVGGTMSMEPNQPQGTRVTLRAPLAPTPSD